MERTTRCDKLRDFNKIFSDSNIISKCNVN